MFVFLKILQCKTGSPNTIFTSAKRFSTLGSTHSIVISFYQAVINMIISLWKSEMNYLQVAQFMQATVHNILFCYLKIAPKISATNDPRLLSSRRCRASHRVFKMHSVPFLPCLRIMKII